MTEYVGLLASIVTLVFDSYWYTPCSTMYNAMTPLGSFGGLQVMLTEVSAFPSYLSSDTGPGAVGYIKEMVFRKCILVKGLAAQHYNFCRYAM